MAKRFQPRSFQSCTNARVSPLSDCSVARRSFHSATVPTQYIKQTTVEWSNRSMKTERNFNVIVSHTVHTCILRQSQGITPTSVLHQCWCVHVHETGGGELQAIPLCPSYTLSSPPPISPTQDSGQICALLGLCPGSMKASKFKQVLGTHYPALGAATP